MPAKSPRWQGFYTVYATQVVSSGYRNEEKAVMRWPRPMRLYSVYTQNTDPTYTQYGRARGRSSCLSLPSTQESGEERADELPGLTASAGETRQEMRRNRKDLPEEVVAV